MGKHKNKTKQVNNNTNNNNNTNTNSDNNDIICPICLDCIEIQGEITTLKCCNHKYHTSCIDTWYKHQMENKQLAPLGMMTPLNKYPPDLNEIIKIIIYLNDGVILTCPTCKCEYDALGGAVNGVIKPFKILGKIQFSPLIPATSATTPHTPAPDTATAPIPTHYITKYEQLFLYLPKTLITTQALLMWAFNFKLLVGGMSDDSGDTIIKAFKCHCKKPECPRIFLLNKTVLSKQTEFYKNLKPLRVDELKELVADEKTVMKTFDLLRKLRVI